MATLSVIQGPDKGRTFDLPPNTPQLIGRSSEALPIADIAVSRRHAELTPDNGQWYLRDLDSQNGTYLNGTRLTERTRLRPGDQVRVGQTLLVFGQPQGSEAVRIVGPQRLDATIERVLPASLNEDSLILGTPDPRAAAVDHLRVLYRLTDLLAEAVTDRAQLLAGILQLVFDEFAAERGCIMLVESPEGTDAAKLRPAAVRYRTTPLNQDDAKIHVSRTILHHVVTRLEGVLSSNAMTDPRFAKGDSVQRLNIRSAVCSPMRWRDRTFGAIYIDSSMANFSFTPEQLALLNAIAQHAAIALATSDLHAQRLQAQRLAAIGETVATLSHSIKNILQGLRGGADVVEMGLKKDDLKVARGGWTILQRNLHRIISLTMNMLAFSRQRTIEPELAALGPILEECASLLEPACAAKQVAILVDAENDMPPISIDPPLVHQALMNLLTNAVEAVEPQTGVVTLRARYDPDAPAAIITIIDNGPGVPADKRPWVFEPFNTTKGARGTGLGLAVARRIAQEHGGSLTLDPAEGRGATFILRLPAQAPGATPIDPSATAHPKGPEKA